MKLTLDQATKR